MLKKLFNNPWFVACMGAFAMIYLGWSIAKPLYFDEGDEFAEGDEYSAEVSDNPASPSCSYSYGRSSLPYSSP